MREKLERNEAWRKGERLEKYRHIPSLCPRVNYSHREGGGKVIMENNRCMVKKERGKESREK